MHKNLQSALCLVLLVLLMGAAMTPTVGTLYQTAFGQSCLAQNDVACTDLTRSEPTPIDLTVTEYRADGSITKTTVRLSSSKMTELETALETTPILQDQIALLIDYQVLPPETSPESLIAEIESQIELIGTTPPDIWLPPFSVMFFSQVSANFRWGTWTRIGMTPFMDLLDRLLGLDFNRGFDFYDFCWGLKGSVYTSGPLGEHSLSLEPGFIVMGGFIGYTIEGRFHRHSFYGAAAVACTAGFGSHDFDPWFP